MIWVQIGESQVGFYLLELPLLSSTKGPLVLNPSAAEITKIIAGFDDSGAKLRSEGMYIQGTKYLVLRADDTSIYAKQGPGGAACCKANTCVVLSVYVEKMTPGNCNVATEALADYLRDNGY